MFKSWIEYDPTRNTYDYRSWIAHSRVMMELFKKQPNWSLQSPNPAPPQRISDSPPTECHTIKGIFSLTKQANVLTRQWTSEVGPVV